MSKFAERLRTLRDDMGLSQKELAGFVGTSKSSINMYERGEREPGFRMQENLADFFNVSIDFLLGRKEVEVEDIVPYTDELGVDHLGDFIKDSRKSRGFSVSELSEETHVPEKTIIAYEEDKIPVKSNVLKKILDVYGITVLDFWDEHGHLEYEARPQFHGDYNRSYAFERAVEQDGLEYSAMLQEKELQTQKELLLKFEDLDDYGKDLVTTVLDKEHTRCTDKTIDITKNIRYLGEIACGEPIIANEEHGEYITTTANIKANYSFKCRGDSMINAGINDGDIVFIHEQPDVNDGEIAAVIIEDETTLKRVYKKGDTLELVAENPKYEPLIYTKEKQGQIKIIGKAVAVQSNIS